MRARLRTLGRFDLEIDGRPVAAPSTQKARALLVFLAMRAGATVPRERVLETFWPEADPGRGRQSLKTATWAIRRVLRGAACDPDDHLLIGKRGLQWTGAIEVDAHAFADLAGRGDPAALDRYAGDFLDGDDDEWTIAERERLEAMYDKFLGRLLRESRNPAIAERLVARDPYDEAAYEVLIEAELAAGRRVAAGLLLRRARMALSELGVAPSAAFEARFAALDTRAAAGSRVRMPFVGRDRELEAVASRGTGSISLVHGDAGMGKTAFLAKVREVAMEGGMRVIAERALTKDARRFGVWPEIFERLTGSSFDDYAQSGGTATTENIAARLVAEVKSPALFVFDDAHLLRGDAWSLLAAVALRLSYAGNTVIIASRPEGVAGLRKACSVDGAGDIELGILSEASVRDAIRAALPDCDEAAAAAIYARSGGHPFYCASLVAVAREDATSAEVPGNVRRFAESRLREAGGCAARVACGLALEPDADAEDLAFALECGDDEVLDAIDDLLARAIVREPRSGRSLAFAHDIYAEAAARLENPGRRVRMHMRFASRIAERGGPDAALREARHLAAAGQPAKAAVAYARSAIEALEWFAWRDALERCASGLEVLRRIGDRREVELTRATLRIVEARAFAGSGDDAAALEPIALAVGHETAADDDRLLMEACRIRAGVLTQARAPQAALDAALAAERAARRCEDDGLLATANTMVAGAHALAGAEAASLEAAETAIACAVRCGRPDAIVTHACHTARVRTFWWRFADADEALAVAAPAVADAGWVGATEYALSAGLLAYHRRALNDARDLCERAVETSDDVGARRWRPKSAAIDRLKLRFHPLLLLAMIASLERRFDDAIGTARPLLDTRIALASTHYRNNVLHVAIDALLGRDTEGDAAQAAALGAQLVDRVYEGGLIYDAGWSVAVTRARIAVRLRMSDAREKLVQAFEAFAPRAARRPLDADRTFAALADAAEELACSDLAAAARAAAAQHAARRSNQVEASFGR